MAEEIKNEKIKEKDNEKKNAGAPTKKRQIRRRKRTDLASKSKYKGKMIDLRRVVRVVKGGKRFSFRATVVIGDGKGNVGIGVAKGADVAQAMDKAKRRAENNITYVLLKDTTIAHEVSAKYSAARVLIKPAIKGSGLKAGGSVRAILLSAGVKDATSKILSKTKNKLTNAMATLKALEQLREKK